MILQRSSVNVLESPSGIYVQENEKDPDVQLTSPPVILTLVKRHETFIIRDLPAINHVSIQQIDRARVFHEQNYGNRRTPGNLTPGIYFYQVMIKNRQGVYKLYKRKLMVVDWNCQGTII